LGVSQLHLGVFIGSATAIAYKDQSEIQLQQLQCAMAADLKKRGFKFVGSKICYAYMQAVGIVNDHTTSCFRFKEILREMANE